MNFSDFACSANLWVDSNPTCNEEHEETKAFTFTTCLEYAFKMYEKSLAKKLFPFSYVAFSNKKK